MPYNNNATGSKSRHKPSSKSKYRTSHDEDSKHLHLRKNKTRKHGGTAQNGGGNPHNEQDSGPQNRERDLAQNKALDQNFDSVIPVPELSLPVSVMVVVAFCLLAHWNGCHGDFVFDDLEAIVRNKDLRPETPVWSLFRHDFWGELVSAKESHKSYRPLTVLSFRMSYMIAGGLHPWGFHLVNILLHTLVSILVLPVSSALLSIQSDAGKGGDIHSLAAPRASLLCAVLFAVHPIHTENVAGVVGRADLLCALFFFLSFLVYKAACREASSCPGRESSVLLSSCQVLLSMALCAVAMLCKEQGITVIGMCSVYDIIINCQINPVTACLRMYEKHHRVSASLRDVLWSQDGRWLRRLLLRHSLLLVSALFLLSFRFMIMGGESPTFQLVDNPASFAQSFFVRVVNYSYIYSLNAWLLLHPWWLCFDWSMGCVPLIQTPLDPRVVAPIIFWLSLAWLVHHCLFGSNQYERRHLITSLAMLVIPFLPASNLFFSVGFVIAERVLYLPSLGFCLLVVMATRHLCLQKSFVLKKGVQGALFLLVAYHVTRCIHRNQEWLKEESLYRAGLRVCPLNAKVHYNIGKSAADLGQEQKAITAYREALRLHPDYDQAMNNLGNLLRDLNQTDEAETLLKQAVNIRPSFAAAWMNLGILQVTLEQYEEAEVSYRSALEHRNNYPDCYFNLGNLYLETRQWDDAFTAWGRAASLKHDHSRAWLNIITLYDDLGNYDTALAVGHEALKHLPREPSLYYILGNVLGKMMRLEEAEEMFLKAIQINPDAANYHGNLGVLYHRWGKLEQAYRCYQRSLTLDPTAEVTAENARKLERTLNKEGKHQ